MTVRLLSIISVLLITVVPTMAESVFAPLGIGVWQRSGSTYSTSVSGSDLALSDSVYFSIDNPATWRSFGLTKFTTSFGVGKYYATDFTGSDIADNYLFPNAAIALPIYKTLGVGFFYQTLTDRDFLIFSEETFDISEQVDTLDSYDILKRTQGTGGLARAGGRVAFLVTTKLSVGIGVDYYFGNLEELITLDFLQGSFLRSGRFQRHELGGIGTSFGINYRPTKETAFAITARTPVNLEVSSSSKIQGGDSTGVKYDDFEIPFGFGIGGLHEIGRLRTLASVQFEAWENSAHSFASDTEYANSLDIGIGFERLPLDQPLIPWYESSTFRAGLRYKQHYIKAGGSNLLTYGASIGMGFPIVGGRGKLDIALTYDMRGLVNDNAASEKIYGIQVGISTTERWFVRRKR